jgi:hypothetical protein
MKKFLSGGSRQKDGKKKPDPWRTTLRRRRTPSQKKPATS